jgi:hypothetical protein
LIDKKNRVVDAEQNRVDYLSNGFFFRSGLNIFWVQFRTSLYFLLTARLHIGGDSESRILHSHGLEVLGKGRKKKKKTKRRNKIDWQRSSRVVEIRGRKLLQISLFSVRVAKCRFSGAKKKIEWKSSVDSLLWKSFSCSNPLFWSFLISHSGITGWTVSERGPDTFGQCPQAPTPSPVPPSTACPTPGASFRAAAP